MDNFKFDWSEVVKISNRFWSDDIELVNEEQVELIQKSIEDNKSIDELFSDFEVGLKMDFVLVLQNAKLIFEIVIIILNIVLLYKNTKKNDSDVILEIRKSAKTKQVDLKMKQLSDNELREMIKMIKASHSFNEGE